MGPSCGIEDRQPAGGVEETHAVARWNGNARPDIIPSAATFQDHRYAQMGAVFFIISIIAAIFGFTGIAAAAAGIAKILFFIFLVICVILRVVGLMAGRAIF
jgi:uncharacterized membrane protein YtjA (UPF0391 family)